MQDFVPAFCEECDVYITAMVDQHGSYYLVCSCPEGRHELPDETSDWLDERSTTQHDGDLV